jgi:hypothetical protein
LSLFVAKQMNSRKEAQKDAKNTEKLVARSLEKGAQKKLGRDAGHSSLESLFVNFEPFCGQTNS